MTKSIFFGFLVFFISLFIGCDSSQLEEERPNILFIAIDDLNDWVGYLGGHPQAKTPNIDRLIKRGVGFSKAYTIAPLCNPSRVALLTGLYPSTTGVYGNRNNFRKTQVIDYVNKLRAKNLEAKYQKELEAKQAAAAEAERQRVAQVQGKLDSGTYVDRDDSGLSASDRAVGGGAKGRAANIDNDKSTGTSQGYSQHYAGGGRVYYMDGGLADMLEIYD